MSSNLGMLKECIRLLEICIHHDTLEDINETQRQNTVNDRERLKHILEEKIRPRLVDLFKKTESLKPTKLASTSVEFLSQTLGIDETKVIELLKGLLESQTVGKETILEQEECCKVIKTYFEEVHNCHTLYTLLCSYAVNCTREVKTKFDAGCPGVFLTENEFASEREDEEWRVWVIQFMVDLVFVKDTHPIQMLIENIGVTENNISVIENVISDTMKPGHVLSEKEYVYDMVRGYLGQTLLHQIEVLYILSSEIILLESCDIIKLMEFVHSCSVVDQKSMKILLALCNSLDTEVQNRPFLDMVKARFENKCLYLTKPDLWKTFVSKMEGIMVGRWNLPQYRSVVMLCWSSFLLMTRNIRKLDGEMRVTYIDVEDKLSNEDSVIESWTNDSMTQGAFKFLLNSILSRKPSVVFEIDPNQLHQVNKGCDVTGTGLVPDHDEGLFQKKRYHMWFPKILESIERLAINVLTHNSVWLRKMKCRDEETILSLSKEIEESSIRNLYDENDSYCIIDDTNLQHSFYFEEFVVLITRIYSNPVPIHIHSFHESGVKSKRTAKDSALHFWIPDNTKLTFFIKWASEARHPILLSSFINMLSAVSNGEKSSLYCFNLLKVSVPENLLWITGKMTLSDSAQNVSKHVLSWNHLFKALRQYLVTFETEGSTMDANHKETMFSGISPLEVVLIESYMKLLCQIITNNKESAILIVESVDWDVIKILFGLLSMGISPRLKSHIVSTIYAISKIEGYNDAVWAKLESSEILSNINIDTHLKGTNNTGIVFELEMFEMSIQYYPLTISFLTLINSLVSNFNPKRHNIDGLKQQEFTLYVRFVVNIVFAKWKQMGFRDKEEKSVMFLVCVKTLVSILSIYKGGNDSGFEILLFLLSGEGLNGSLSTLFDILIQEGLSYSPQTLYYSHVYSSVITKYSLKLVYLSLIKQDIFVKTVENELKRRFSLIQDWMFLKKNLIVNLMMFFNLTSYNLKYILDEDTQNRFKIPLLVTKILACLVSTPCFCITKDNDKLMMLLLSSGDNGSIRDGFVNSFLSLHGNMTIHIPNVFDTWSRSDTTTKELDKSIATKEHGHIYPYEVFDYSKESHDYRHIGWRFADVYLGSISSQLQVSILNLFIAILKRGNSIGFKKTLAHYLLGYDISKNSDKKDIGVCDLDMFSDGCLKVILEILSLDINNEGSRKYDKSLQLFVDYPLLFEKAYEVVMLLCKPSHVYVKQGICDTVSLGTLKYLCLFTSKRTGESFLEMQIRETSEWINMYVEDKADEQQPNEDIFTIEFLFCMLSSVSCILDIIATFVYNESAVCNVDKKNNRLKIYECLFGENGKSSLITNVYRFIVGLVPSDVVLHDLVEVENDPSSPFASDLYLNIQTDDFVISEPFMHYNSSKIENYFKELLLYYHVKRLFNDDERRNELIVEAGRIINKIKQINQMKALFWCQLSCLKSFNHLSTLIAKISFKKINNNTKDARTVQEEFGNSGIKTDINRYWLDMMKMMLEALSSDTYWPQGHLFVLSKILIGICHPIADSKTLLNDTESFSASKTLFNILESVLNLTTHQPFSKESRCHCYIFIMLVIQWGRSCQINDFVGSENLVDYVGKLYRQLIQDSIYSGNEDIFQYIAIQCLSAITSILHNAPIDSCFAVDILYFIEGNGTVVSDVLESIVSNCSRCIGSVNNGNDNEDVVRYVPNMYQGKVQWIVEMILLEQKHRQDGGFVSRYVMDTVNEFKFLNTTPIAPSVPAHRDANGLYYDLVLPFLRVLCITCAKSAEKGNTGMFVKIAKIVCSCQEMFVYVLKSGLRYVSRGSAESMMEGHSISESLNMILFLLAKIMVCYEKFDEKTINTLSVFRSCIGEVLMELSSNKEIIDKTMSSVHTDGEDSESFWIHTFLCLINYYKTWDDLHLRTSARDSIKGYIFVAFMPLLKDSSGLTHNPTLKFRPPIGCVFSYMNAIYTFMDRQFEVSAVKFKHTLFSLVELSLYVIVRHYEHYTDKEIWGTLISESSRILENKGGSRLHGVKNSASSVITGYETNQLLESFLMDSKDMLGSLVQRIENYLNGDVFNTDSKEMELVKVLVKKCQLWASFN